MIELLMIERERFLDYNSKMLKVLKVIFCIFVCSLKINISASAPPATTHANATISVSSDENKPSKKERIYAVSFPNYKQTIYSDNHFIVYTPLEINDNQINLERLEINSNNYNILFLLKLDDSENAFANLTTKKYKLETCFDHFDENKQITQTSTFSVIDGCSALIFPNHLSSNFLQSSIEVAIRLIRAKELSDQESRRASTQGNQNFYFTFPDILCIEQNLNPTELSSNDATKIMSYFDNFMSKKDQIKNYNNYNTNNSHFKKEIEILLAKIKKIEELRNNIEKFDKYDKEITNADGFFKKAWGKIKRFFFKIKLWFKYNKYERNAIYVIYRHNLK